MISVSLVLALAAWHLSAPGARAGGAVHECMERAERGDVAACEKAAEDAPENIEVRRALARAYIEIGDFASVVDIYEAIVAERPADFEALHDLSGTLGFIRRYDRAVVVLERMTELQPESIETYMALAIAYRHLDRPKDVLSATARAAELGDRVAMFDMFIYQRDGFGAAPDAGSALRWAEKAAEAGHQMAMTQLIDVYLMGQMGAGVDETRAEKWARRLHRLNAE